MVGRGKEGVCVCVCEGGERVRLARTKEKKATKKGREVVVDEGKRPPPSRPVLRASLDESVSFESNELKQSCLRVGPTRDRGRSVGEGRLTRF